MKFIFFLRGIFYSASCIFCLLLFSSCASNPVISAQINSLVVAEKFDYARTLMSENPQAYEQKDQLLYWLDYGLLLHLAGQYEESISAFQKAKGMYQALYTESITKKSMTWIINDNIAPYRGEDFERVIINIFQALNYVQLGNVEEALVEARDVDSTLNSINQQYKGGEKNIYIEDAFARFLSGIFYEMAGTTSDINDAYIAYRKAVKIYEDIFKPHYRVTVPQILKENILTVAQQIDQEEYERLKNKYAYLDTISLEEKRKKVEVYLILYYGLSPIKHETFIVVPLPEGFIYKLAFPTYDKREYEKEKLKFTAKNENEEEFDADIQSAHNITAVAIQNLDRRRLRVLAKASLRSSGKYYLERTQEDMIRNRYSDDAADAFRYVSSIFNLATEQADLRSWQTLPGEILISRLLLDPGEYEFFYKKESLGKKTLKAGEKEFFILRKNH